VPMDPPVLLTEALRGAGAKIVDEEGREIVNPLIPRDELARFIYNFTKRYGKVFLDVSRVDLERFPIARRFREIFGDRIPIEPAAHYSIGGIRTNAWGRTSVKGLWAVGECADTGVHGANRLASNSLAEGLVFGYRVAIDIENNLSEWEEFNFLKILEVEFKEGEENIQEVRKIMDAYVGVVREGKDLSYAVENLKNFGGLGNLARWVALSALLREESRGVHYRSDFPEERSEFCGRFGIRVI